MAAGIATLLIGVAILAQILLRLFGIFLPGAVEISTYAMLAGVFLGLPVTYVRRGHIRVTLLVQCTHGVVRKWAEAVSRSIALIWLLYMDYWTFALVLRSYEKGAMTSGLLVIPLWLPQFLIPLGVTLMCLSILRSLVVLLRDQESIEHLYSDPSI